MKNRPRFSLRSNSIESRFRSIRRGDFWDHPVMALRKIKSNSEFASLISFLLATLDLDSIFYI